MQRALAFLAVPLLSGYFSLSDLGEYSLTQAFAQFAIPVLTANCTVALAREAFNNPKAAMGLLNRVSLFTVIVGTLAAIATYFADAPTWITLGCILGSSEACFATSTGTLQGREDAHLVFIASFVKTIGLGLAILAAPLFHLSWQQLVLLQIGNSMIASLIAFGSAHLAIKPLLASGDKEQISIETMVRYSAATLPHTVALWLSISSDRLLLGALRGRDAVGAYAIVHPLALAIMLLMSGVIVALPTRIAADPDTWRAPAYPSQLIRRLTLTVGSVLILGIIALAINKYFHIFPIVQPHYILVYACLGFGFYLSFYYVLFSSYLYLNRNTASLGYAGFYLGPINLGVMASLVWIGGGVGAAFGQMFCYTSFAVAYFIYARRLEPGLNSVGKNALHDSATLLAVLLLLTALL